jgi:hypothetical protein
MEIQVEAHMEIRIEIWVEIRIEIWVAHPKWVANPKRVAHPLQSHRKGWVIERSSTALL